MLFLLLVFAGCEEKIDWDLKTEQINTIVVDAIITNEVKYQHIHLTKPFTDQNDTAVPVSGAQVFIKTNNSMVLFLESPDKPGHYYSDYPGAGSIDIAYQLNIEFESELLLNTTHLSKPCMKPSFPGRIW
jgi:hypothetical protein